MKNIILFFLLTSGIVVSAQTYQNERVMVESSSLQSSNEQLNYLINNKSTFNSTANSGNSVFIDQVGQGNLADVLVISNDSQINLTQEGFNNRSFIYLRSDVIRENVLQRGNQNLFFDYSLHGAKTHTVNLIQDGDYNEVISVGKNSISERIELNQTGVGGKAYMIHN